MSNQIRQIIPSQDIKGELLQQYKLLFDRTENQPAERNCCRFYANQNLQ